MLHTQLLPTTAEEQIAMTPLKGTLEKV